MGIGKRDKPEPETAEPEAEVVKRGRGRPRKPKPLPDPEKEKRNEFSIKKLGNNEEKFKLLNKELSLCVGEADKLKVRNKISALKTRIKKA